MKMKNPKKLIEVALLIEAMNVAATWQVNFAHIVLVMAETGVPNMQMAFEME